MQNVQESFSGRWFDEVWNNGNEEAIDRMFHPEGIAHGLGEPLRGPGQFKPFFHSFRDAYSNIHVVVDRVYRIGDVEISMCTVNATHNASGNDVNFKGVCEMHLEDNRIREGHNLFDFLSMNLQNGKITPDQLM